MRRRDAVLLALGGLLGAVLLIPRAVAQSASDIFQVLSDYQNEPNGGNGWLRIMTFRPSENVIDVRTYSPFLNQYQTDADSQFLIPYKMKAGDPFTIIVISDTQYYSKQYPQIFQQMTTWIRNNRDLLNIVFTIHLGDVVDNYADSAQWYASKDAMVILSNSNLPYSILPGNHDFNPAVDNKLSYFYLMYGPQEFTNDPYYAGSYNNDNFNNVNKFTIGSNTFLVLSLQASPPQAVIDWANAQIVANPDCNVILATHEYLLSGTNPVSRSTVGENIFNQVVKPHEDQVKLVLCGHFAGEGVRRGVLGKNLLVTHP